MLDLATYIPVSSPWLILLFSQKKTKKLIFLKLSPATCKDYEQPGQ